MDAEQLWETTLNPESRTLNRITLEEIEEELIRTDSLISILMGDDVGQRRRYIIENSSLVKYLDI